MLVAKCLPLVMLFVVLSTPGYAIDVRRGSPQIAVAAGDTVDDTLVAFGDTVTVDGTVNGDLVAFVRLVIVRGTIRGDVFSFARRIEISGTVEGNLLGFGQTVQSRGHVGSNLYGFAQSLTVSDSARIEGNATTFTQETTVDGAIGRDLTTFGERLDVRGSVAHDIVAWGQRVTLTAPARVGGDLTARVRNPENVVIDEGATIAGRTDIEVRQPEPRRYSTVPFYIRQAIWLAAAFITGLLLFWLVPALARPPLESGQALLKAGGIGFLAAIAVPVAAMILGITLVGLPVALFSLLLWIAGLYLAKIVVAAFLGQALLRGGSRAVALLAGLVLVRIAINLPYVGSVINVVLTLVGFGAILITLYYWRPGVALEA